MRQRGVGWMGAIAAMVVAGLIVYGIIYYGPRIWSGIQNGTSGGGVTSLEDICRYSNNYINENVIVEGQLALNDGGLIDPYFENAGASLFSMVFQVEINYPYHVWSIRFYGVSTDGLVVLDKIRLTGRIVELTPRYAENFFGNIVAIQASEIELIN